ncbi:MAG: acetyl-CoA carboxylase biotin carboxylase subunit [Gemmatimonadota bacterium]
MESVLIANRGEIAVRVVRACRELGLRSVAVYSDADRQAPHVLLADEAYRLGPAPAAESYLRGDLLVEVALRSGADAVHPGYGFLAERADFARLVEESGLVFVGPSSSSIAAMGDKTEARRRMREAGVPIVPGTVEPVGDLDDALAAAEDIGYPLVIKASAGGGGKGMRSVEGPRELESALAAARREATAAFGDGAVYLERFLVRPRHIEVQLLGDTHGNVVHLGERECSIQRRHQKLIEEAPSSVLSPEEREAMGSAAVRAAESVGYRGAGTVEFLYQDGAFHFLEMNTRIQVEHPVTEMVTGIDLVQWQLRIARGERLPFAQDGIRLRGHALECRITAEQPAGGFLPASGTIDFFAPPSGPWVRWDGGIEQGTEVGLHYDSLLGKLVVWAPSREEAVERMARALHELLITGVETSVGFHRRVMEEADFRAGRLDIGYVDAHPRVVTGSRPGETGRDPRTAAVLGALLEVERRRDLSPPRIRPDADARNLSAWQLEGRTP